MSDVDEAVLAMWAQGELPGAVKPVSNLYVGTVCNCGENWNVNFIFFKLFLYRRLVASLRPRQRWTRRSRLLDPLAFAVGGARLSHHPTRPLWTLWRRCVKIIIVIILRSMYHID